MHRQEIQNSSFLITGGAGFIGSNLAIHLLENGAKFVRVLDNLSSGRTENIKNLEKAENFDFLEGDIREQEVCQNACQNIDYVFHKAALVSVAKSVKNPKETKEINEGGFENIIKSAQKANVKRVVYASSAAVYGDSKTKRKKETDPLNPLSPYAESKVENEKFAQNARIATVGLRYFNVYGQKQDPNSEYSAVIPLFIKAILSNNPVRIISDGEQTRDFIHINDVVKADLLAAFSFLESRACVFNVASGKKTSINQLVQELEKISKRNIKKESIPERMEEIKNSLASIKKIEAGLGFHPEVSLKEGVKKTFEWYRAEYET